MKKVLTPVAKKLRNNLTDAEKHLWYVLRLNNLGVKFRRQAQIGKYIVDFVCFERKLVIEIDGSQHADSISDKVRDSWLKSQGFKVLRFWNNEVLENREGVVEVILKAI
ncbi:MAG: DUF559 domain-containing protein [bacterium]|nr:DUF559 domain-containing protein [bacterium]